MYAILSRYFVGVEPSQFESDLDEKDWVILLEESGGSLLGFSTFSLYSTEHAGEPLSVICSGDTIVERRAWMSRSLFQTWLKTVHSLHDWKHGGRLFWLLIVSGYRTYRILPVFFREFFPRYDRPTPAREQAMIHGLASERFGGAYDAPNGIVRLPHPQPLREDLARIPVGRSGNPHVRFFERSNRGHASGDELVCLAEFGASNLTDVGLRMIAEGSR